jgi:hypothetical protein
VVQYLLSAETVCPIHLCWVANRLPGGPVVLRGSASVRFVGECQLEGGLLRFPLQTFGSTLDLTEV